MSKRVTGWQRLELELSRTITILPVISVHRCSLTSANLVTNDSTPDFAWNSVPYGVTYEMQIDHLSTFTAPVEQTANGLGLTYTASPALSMSGLKYWRVRASTSTSKWRLECCPSYHHQGLAALRPDSVRLPAMPCDRLHSNAGLECVTLASETSFGTTSEYTMVNIKRKEEKKIKEKR